MSGKFVLGIDTSNYKTSVAVVDRNLDIVYQSGQLLEVDKGTRGLRQSEALFRHIKKLPSLIEKIPVDLAGELEGVAWSNAPRPVKGSYMPVFLAGESVGRSIAATSGVQGIGFSHQEGHIEAIRSDCGLETEGPFLACHFSGGTTEILICSPRKRNHTLDTGVFYDIEKIGGTLDISYGQVLDRAGVEMGFDFPAGQALDDIVSDAAEMTDLLAPVKAMSGKVNLSGIDSQIKRVLQQGAAEGREAAFIHEIFERITCSIIDSLTQISAITGIREVLMAGGVSSSRWIRNRVKNSAAGSELDIRFGQPSLSTDNAVGIAILGGRYVWD